MSTMREGKRWRLRRTPNAAASGGTGAPARKRRATLCAFSQHAFLQVALCAARCGIGVRRRRDLLPFAAS